MKTNNYEKQSEKFLEKTGTTFRCEFLKNDFYFYGDKEEIDIYKITLKKGSRKYSFNFGQSLNNSGFYFTMGERHINLDRSLLEKTDSEIARYIKLNINMGFLNNGKSDIIVRPKAPTAYDILSGLTKYDPVDFENFCYDYGYDTDSRTAKKTFKAVVKEWGMVQSIWSDEEIDQLCEIN